MQKVALVMSCLCLAVPAGCRKPKQAKPDKPIQQADLATAGASTAGADKKLCFKKIWGPLKLSSGEANVTGMSAATGVGQAGAMWIEVGQKGSEVYFTRITGGTKGQTIRMTKGASAFPPTSAAWTGKDFALAWGDDRFRRIEIFIARVSPVGKITLAPRQFTQTRPSKQSDVYSSDSSQEPALACSGGNLLIIWGGPGDYGRQQIYHTTISKSGKPLYAPYEITKGPFDHSGLNLVSFEEGASIFFCALKGDINEIYRGVLSGAPPKIASQPSKVAGTLYSPCQSQEVDTGENRVILWPEKKESESLVTAGLSMAVILPTGEFGSAAELESLHLIKFPGKFRRAFDAAGAGGKVAVAWVDSPPGGEQGIKAGIYSDAGSCLCEPLPLEAQLIPTDPRMLYSGFGRQYVVLWVDRRPGGDSYTLEAEGIEIAI
jgi:hypothetical protein